MVFFRSVMFQCPLCHEFGDDRVFIVKHIRFYHQNWQKLLNYQKPLLKTAAVKTKKGDAEPLSIYDPSEVNNTETDTETIYDPSEVDNTETDTETEFDEDTFEDPIS